jgi:hypothetical protein
LLPPGIDFEQEYQVHYPLCLNGFSFKPLFDSLLILPAQQQLTCSPCFALQTGVCNELTIAEGAYNCSCMPGFMKPGAESEEEEPVGEILRRSSTNDSSTNGTNGSSADDSSAKDDTPCVGESANISVSRQSVYARTWHNHFTCFSITIGVIQNTRFKKRACLTCA